MTTLYVLGSIWALIGAVFGLRSAVHVERHSPDNGYIAFVVMFVGWPVFALEAVTVVVVGLSILIANRKG